MEKIVKENLNEDYRFNGGYESEEKEKAGIFTDDDGWDEGSLANTGLLEVLSFAAKIQYEILNGRRGSYAISGDTAEDLLKDLEELKDMLEATIDTITEQI